MINKHILATIKQALNVSRIVKITRDSEHSLVRSISVVEVCFNGSVFVFKSPLKKQFRTFLFSLRLSPSEIWERLKRSLGVVAQPTWSAFQ